MRFQPVKCNMMHLTRKPIKKNLASYTLEETDLENVERIKYLGVTITSDLRWNTHVSNVCTKANRTLGFPKRNLYSFPQEVGAPSPGLWQFSLGPLGVCVYSGLTSLSTFFQSYHDGLWLRQGAQCSLL